LTYTQESISDTQIELPNDVHPLPEDITAYVSYDTYRPFYDELTNSSSTLSTWRRMFFLYILSLMIPYLRDELGTLRYYMSGR
jgi:hypothetical protein